MKALFKTALFIVGIIIFTVLIVVSIIFKKFDDLLFRVFYGKDI